MKIQILLGLLLASTCLIDQVSANFRDSRGRIYRTSVTPNRDYVVIISEGKTKRRLLANQCGLIIVPQPRVPDYDQFNRRIEIEGVLTIDNPNQLPLRAIPRCINGVLDIPVEENFSTPRGQTVLINQVPNLAIEVTLTSRLQRTFRSDSCGILRLTSSASFDLLAENIGDVMAEGAGGIFIPQSETFSVPLCYRDVEYSKSPEL